MLLLTSEVQWDLQLALATIDVKVPIFNSMSGETLK